jgi:hypothetical protein
VEDEDFIEAPTPEKDEDLLASAAEGETIPAGKDEEEELPGLSTEEKDSLLAEESVMADASAEAAAAPEKVEEEGEVAAEAGEKAEEPLEGEATTAKDEGVRAVGSVMALVIMGLRRVRIDLEWSISAD